MTWRWMDARSSSTSSMISRTGRGCACKTFEGGRRAYKCADASSNASWHTDMFCVEDGKRPGEGETGLKLSRLVTLRDEVEDEITEEMWAKTLNNGEVECGGQGWRVGVPCLREWTDWWGSGTGTVRDVWQRTSSLIKLSLDGKKL